MKLIVGALAVAMLAGCNDQAKNHEGLLKATKDVEALPISANSPDAAVKSWWAVKDAGIRLDRELCIEYMKMIAPTTEKLSKLAVESFPFRDQCSVTQAYERKITKVEIQSDTRAVVNAVIKNVEPADAGAVLDDSDKKAKEAGEPFRYTLERGKSTDDWKIATIENFPSYARDWEETYPKPKPSSNRYIVGQFQ